MRFSSRRSVAVVVVVAAAALGLIAGCAKAPQQEIAAAKAAIEAAKGAEANTYLADRFVAAEDSLKSALSEVEKQNSAMALSRNYAEATRKLQVVATLSAGLQADAPAAKEAAKAEIEAALTAAQAAQVAARDLLKKAPKGKEGKEALLAIESDLGTIDTALIQATADVAQGSYTVAKDKVTAAAAKTASITAELTAAIEKVKGKGKK